MLVEKPFGFYARYAAETAVKARHYLAVYREARRALKQVMGAPDRWTYTVLAITPPREDEHESRELYTASISGEAAVARMRREAEARTRVATVNARRAVAAE